MIEIIVIILIMIGILLSLLSSLGFLRLPDVYTRIHAGAKGTTLGTLLILFSAFLYFWVVHGTISIRLILVIVFVFLTAPVSGQLVIRAAYRSGVKLADVSAKDELGRDLAKHEKLKQSELKQSEALGETVGSDDVVDHTDRDESED